MALMSMTGFGRAQGELGAARWAWEIRSVNAKGLDVRLRTPPGMDTLDAQASEAIGKRLKRGAVQVSLNLTRQASPTKAIINSDLMDQLVKALEPYAGRPGFAPASLDGLLAIKGVLEFESAEESVEDRAQLIAALLASLQEALNQLCAMRAAEGAALEDILRKRVARIAALTAAAESAPGRKPEAIRARLAQMVSQLSEAQTLDPQRLHQEAVLLASKADVREELDRLVAHCAAFAEALDAEGPIGRRLDFLAQEFSRESNTLCAKSNDSDLTSIGLDLKLEVEQLREQVQNVE